MVGEVQTKLPPKAKQHRHLFNAPYNSILVQDHRKWILQLVIATHDTVSEKKLKVNKGSLILSPPNRLINWSSRLYACYFINYNNIDIKTQIKEY